MTVDDSVSFSYSSSGVKTTLLENLDNGAYTRVKIDLTRGSYAPELNSYTVNTDVPLGPNEPDNLQVSDTDTTTPAFSWTYTNDNAGDNQTAFEIEVGENMGDNDIYDNTFWTQDESVTLDLPLNENTEYWWRVRTYDNEAWSPWADDNFKIIFPDETAGGGGGADKPVQPPTEEEEGPEGLLTLTLLSYGPLFLDLWMVLIAGAAGSYFNDQKALAGVFLLALVFLGLFYGQFV
jgi:predicted secreted protein